MAKEVPNKWQDDYFDSIRSSSSSVIHKSDQKTDDRVRWGGTGSVDIIYYLADERLLDFVKFSWRIVSERPGLTAPTSFQKVPHTLLPHLERAQSSNREVFVDFWTDNKGENAEVITIATL